MGIPRNSSKRLLHGWTAVRREQPRALQLRGRKIRHRQNFERVCRDRVLHAIEETSAFGVEIAPVAEQRLHVEPLALDVAQIGLKLKRLVVARQRLVEGAER